MMSGPNVAARTGTRARTAASHAVSPVYGSSGTLTAVPAAAPSPRSSMNPVPGNRYRPLSWSEIVRTPGSPKNTASTPSPWWVSRSTYSTRSPAARARAIASAGSL